MTSTRQLASNRANARRSTGPKTASGKARVAHNPVTHGLLAHNTLLPDEDPQELQALADTLRAEHNPQGAQEHLLVDMMIRAVWRLGRLGRVEAGVYARKHAGILAERASCAARTYERDAVSGFGEQNPQPTTADAEKHAGRADDDPARKPCSHAWAHLYPRLAARTRCPSCTVTRRASSALTSAPSMNSNGSNTPGSAGTCRRQWPSTLASITEPKAERTARLEALRPAGPEDRRWALRPGPEG